MDKKKKSKPAVLHSKTAEARRKKRFKAGNSDIHKMRGDALGAKPRDKDPKFSSSQALNRAGLENKADIRSITHKSVLRSLAAREVSKAAPESRSKKNEASRASRAAHNNTDTEFENRKKAKADAEAKHLRKQREGVHKTFRQALDAARKRTKQ